ncbi:hypothetical protein BHE74_00010952 [Ensete ventricosum]|nr:hypothetical protein BHE74_00010952 [Ensete ventricosum]
MFERGGVTHDPKPSRAEKACTQFQWNDASALTYNPGAMVYTRITSRASFSRSATCYEPTPALVTQASVALCPRLVVGSSPAPSPHYW